MPYEIWFGCRCILNFNNVSVIVGVGVVAQIVFQLGLVRMVSETVVVPVFSIVKIQFLGKQRRAPRTDATETKNPATVDTAEIQHLAVQYSPL